MLRLEAVLQLRPQQTRQQQQQRRQRQQQLQLQPTLPLQHMASRTIQAIRIHIWASTGIRVTHQRRAPHPLEFHLASLAKRRQPQKTAAAEVGVPVLDGKRRRREIGKGARVAVPERQSIR
mmetsp:Transcript_33759/g.41577  ORF Transcript_33759/g.41577 Transcript_33759/m.41577 type:complete len:121 (+) Transcript_33759:453-815(+)